MGLSITLIIIIITVITSLRAQRDPQLYNRMLFNPYQTYHGKQWYRLFSHGLIHDNNNIFHLVFNMYVLYSFGKVVESTLIRNLSFVGVIYFLILYIGGMVIATLPALLKHRDNYHYNSVGASGAVSAVLFASIAMFPFSGGISIIFIPISIPPLIFGVLYIAYEMYMEKRGGTNIAHDAHIWGAIFGFFFILVFIPGAFSNFVLQVMSVFN